MKFWPSKHASQEEKAHLDKIAILNRDIKTKTQEINDLIDEIRGEKELKERRQINGSKCSAS